MSCQKPELDACHDWHVGSVDSSILLDHTQTHIFMLSNEHWTTCLWEGYHNKQSFRTWVSGFEYIIIVSIFKCPARNQSFMLVTTDMLAV